MEQQLKLLLQTPTSLYQGSGSSPNYPVLLIQHPANVAAADGPRTHKGHPDAGPGPWLWPGSAPATPGIQKMNHQVEDPLLLPRPPSVTLPFK